MQIRPNLSYSEDKYSIPRVNETRMASESAILSESERELLMNDPGEPSRSELICSLEQRVREELPLDLQVLRNQDPWLFEELLRQMESHRD